MDASTQSGLAPDCTVFAVHGKERRSLRAFGDKPHLDLVF